MVENKVIVSWTIDADIVKKVISDSAKFDRSKSYIANQLLREVVDSKKEKFSNKFFNKIQ